MSIYLFADGGYLRDKYRTCMQKYFESDGELALSQLPYAMQRKFESFQVRKMFYYDSVEEDDEQATTPLDAEKTAFLTSIRELPGWHVRQGKLVGEGKRRRQKRVDVMLAVDMLSHAFNKNMSEAVLIAGDDDFTPLVAELHRHGTFVRVFCDSSGRSLDLVHAADSFHSMDLVFYWSISSPEFRTLNPLPEPQTKVMRGYKTALRSGISVRGEHTLLIKEQDDFHYCVFIGRECFSRLSSPNLPLLDTLIQLKLGDSHYALKEWRENMRTEHNLKGCQ